MATYTYEEIYSDPKKAIIRSSSDANIVGLRNGQEVAVVCDRKWGEFTPSVMPLCFTAKTPSSTVALNKFGTFTTSYKYSLDNVTWQNYTMGTAITLSNVGDKIYFKGSRDAQSSSRNIYFVLTGEIDASGNVNSLLSEDFADITDLTSYGDYTFSHLFNRCNSLQTAPELPATALAKYCYDKMFYSCTALASAPELPAVRLAANCYSSMFYGCDSLQVASKLPATTLATGCYRNMFSGCGSLREVKCYATDISATLSTYQWLSGVSSTGTFYKVAGVVWSTGISGIPSGWTVVEMEAQS